MISSDDVDSIRLPLYEARNAIIDCSTRFSSREFTQLARHLNTAIDYADNLRMDALVKLLNKPGKKENLYHEKI